MRFVSSSRITFNAAGGGETILGERVGIGGEIGFFNRLIVGSGNVTLHLGSVPGMRLSPFVTAGYSRFGIGDGEGAYSAFNAGAGVHLWPGDRVGIRLELRDHVRPDDRGTTHYWSARVGIAIR